MKWITAYRAEHTNWEWYQMGSFDDLRKAERSAQDRIPEMPHCEIAVFGMNEGATYWKDRRPSRLYNRQPRPDAPIPASIGGIINGMYKPGKNP